jgi:hypothetical protein
VVHWRTISSSFLLNGQPGKRIYHCRGVWHGDPLSPMLFLLAMEPMHRLFKKAQEMGLLSNLTKGCDSFRVSLYADDAAVFIKPTQHDLKVTIDIMSVFAEASGLFTNMAKTECFPIRYENLDLDFTSSFQLVSSSFPYKYLGLPLHYKKPSREMFQPLIQKMHNRLLGWKRKFFSYPGRKTLVKSVLTALPTYFMSVLRMPKWAIAKMDRIRSFLCKGQDIEKVKGGHCLVNRQTCFRAKKWGGLRITDLDRFSRALRLRWLWHHWDHIDRPWKNLLKVTDKVDRQLFFT